MITLGINAAFHDSAATLVRDGAVVAAAEEERFTRIKHGKRPVPFSAWEVPFNAIDLRQREAGLTLAEVDPVACSDDPQRFLRDRLPDGQALLPMDPARHEVGASINTSFNVRGEPVVCSPKDAIDAFFSTPLDALVIGRFLVEKR